MQEERRKKWTLENVVYMLAILGSIVGFFVKINTIVSAQTTQEERLCKVEGKAEQIPLMQKDIDYIRLTVDRIDRKLSR